MEATAEGHPVALITGGGRRVGAVIARNLHTAGYDLALHYRKSIAEARELAAELESIRAGSVLLLEADLGDAEGLPRLIGDCVRRFGRLDALVNNASAFYPTPVGSATPAQWDELFASNARAPFFLAQAAAPFLRESRGAIVNMVDIYAERPLTDHALYCMAKAALVTMTQALARDLGPEVRVNAVAPGAVMWPEDGKAEADRQELLAKTALGRIGTPEDVAEAVRWLIQDAHYTTGQVIRVDGGRALTI
jgi:pteridine reductase